MFAAPNTGEMERLADIFTEYQVPFRLGHAHARPGSETYLVETAYFSAIFLPPRSSARQCRRESLCRTPVWLCSARAICLTIQRWNRN